MYMYIDKLCIIVVFVGKIYIYTIHGVIKYIEQKCSWTYIHVKACKQIASSVVNCTNILIGICYIMIIYI